MQMEVKPHLLRNLIVLMGITVLFVVLSGCSHPAPSAAENKKAWTAGKPPSWYHGPGQPGGPPNGPPPTGPPAGAKTGG